MTASKEQKQYAAKVARRLTKLFPDAVCSLDYDGPLQLLVATILSAQCTDERVNIVTKDLFRKYAAASDYADAAIEDLEADIKSTGFYRNKAKAIQGCCRILADEFDGAVPADLDALVKMPGVGRKTANVVLGNAFGVATGVVVDTHVGRIAQRLGLTQQKDPVKIEADLMAVLPKKEWVAFSHRLIHHGRATCKARKALCEDCALADICPRVGVEG